MTERLIEEGEILDWLSVGATDRKGLEEAILSLCNRYEEGIAALVERNRELLQNVEARDNLKRQMADLIESHAGRLSVLLITDEVLNNFVESVKATNVSDKAT